MYVLRNTEVCTCNHCCNGKEMSITYAECAFVALGIQHAMRIACSALPYFSILYQKRMIFGVKLVNIKCVF